MNKRQLIERLAEFGDDEEILIASPNGDDCEYLIAVPLWGIGRAVVIYDKDMGEDIIQDGECSEGDRCVLVLNVE